MQIYTGTIASSFQDVNFMVLDIIELLKTKCEIQEKKLLFKISFMLREVLNNAVEHGNEFQVEKKVFCQVAYDSPLLIFTIRDEGQGIDILKEPFILNTDYLLRERHRGHALIQELNFLVEIQGNEVIVKLDLSKTKEGGSLNGENH